MNNGHTTAGTIMDEKTLLTIAGKYLPSEVSALTRDQLHGVATAILRGTDPKIIEPPSAEHLLTLDILNTLIAFFTLTLEIEKYLRERRKAARAAKMSPDELISLQKDISERLGVE